ncbi:MAG: hypothetical protein EZS28_045482, partial [Streblomastix strix]
GQIVHTIPNKIFIHTRKNNKYENGEIVTAEVNMHIQKERRTLHFFVKGLWQQYLFSRLPDSIKFCVKRSYYNSSVSILSMEKLPCSSVTQQIPGQFVMKW